nr:uncharacterized protein LOC120967780 [Aegilops tauschii subsp. strangulata]XP_040249951.1 uncharacterized protein LOC120967780 [Aegilops tauschii subsp. strangulata]XP_040249952.1 uncharacterized protein LOC120967780 [Aegilops tauschii subsp. strangulata]
MATRLGPDHEISWHTRLFVRRHIVPAGRRALRPETCVFNAVPACAEMDAKRAAALKGLPCNLRINDNRLVDQYEFIADRIPNDRLDRAATAIRILMEDGVPATQGSADHEEMLFKIEGFTSYGDQLIVEEAMLLILNGQPFVGEFMICDNYLELQPGEIYKFDPVNLIYGPPRGHMVLFVGYGVRNGEFYLVFLDSNGEGFCEDGFGRVSFGDVYNIFSIHT